MLRFNYHQIVDYFMFYKVNIIIEKDEDGYYAYSPELPGCQSQGDSLEEVSSNIKEAVELYLETLSESEKQELSKKEILTMTLEVKVA
ncbi:MAG: type II toxin-antitoxin system HicB family antitoxin [Nostoc sp.]|uniref:type II toxin-antitoxin system HicB family antitoxin n=1 Tax=Nostoc sp. TaxID=1180 RepID=UPI002FF86B33